MIYKEDWTSWGDFLGTGVIADKNKNFMPFEECKKWFIDKSIKSEGDWKNYKKNNFKPINIPSDPYSVYKNKGWVSWPDFLGKE